MEKIYRVQLNSKGAPNFSTAKEITYCYNCKWHITNLTEFSSDEDYLKCPIENASASSLDFCSRAEREGD